MKDWLSEKHGSLIWFNVFTTPANHANRNWIKGQQQIKHAVACKSTGLNADKHVSAPMLSASLDSHGSAATAATARTWLDTHGFTVHQE